VILLLALLLNQHGHLAESTLNASTTTATTPTLSITPAKIGESHKLNYDQWVQQLGREAKVIAQKSPPHLYILAGDSLSLWFPVESLPGGDVTWLNQGISGDTSFGLLRRVKLFDQTKPQTVFVMIGINDLVQGMRYETVAANHREIIKHLKTAHPNATIVVQSILPHGGDRAVQQYLIEMQQDPTIKATLPLWVKRLPVITNPSIRRLNKRLALIAQEEKVQFLDLHPLFADAQGNLQEKLTTDGLHLNSAGYAIWRSQLQPFFPPTPTAVSHR